MSIVAWIALGLVMGALIGWFGGRRGRELVASIVVGALGAVIGGFIAAVLLGLEIVTIDPTSVVVAAIGALVLILFERSIPATDVYN